MADNEKSPDLKQPINERTYILDIEGKKVTLRTKSGISWSGICLSYDKYEGMLIEINSEKDPYNIFITESSIESFAWRGIVKYE